MSVTELLGLMAFVSAVLGALVLSLVVQLPRNALRAAVLEHLATATRCRLPLGPALLALANEHQEAARRLRGRRVAREVEVLRGLAERVESTGSLAAALHGAPRRLFGAELVEDLRRAEARGALPELLDLLHREEHQAAAAGWRLIERLAYPAVLVVAVATLSATLDLVVVPQLERIALGLRSPWHADIGPLSTLFLLGLLSLGLATWGAIVRGGVVGRAIGRAGLRLASAAPLAGPAVRRLLHARWMGRAAAALRAGTTLGEALAAATPEHGPLAGGLQAAQERARVGAPPAEVFGAALGRDGPALLPGLLLAVDGAGPAAGLAGTARRLSSCSGRRLSALLEAAKPLPILLCAAVVALHSWSAWELILRNQQLILEGTR